MTAQPSPLLISQLLSDVETLLEERFRACCWDRACLWLDGEISFHDAVDELQFNAECFGLIDVLGQDHIQRLMSEAFAHVA